MISETYTGPERRQAPRVRYRGMAQLSMAGLQGASQSETVMFVNLSEIGACVKSAAGFRAGTEVFFNFTLPGLLNVQCNTKAKIVWASSYAENGYYLLGVVFGFLQPFAFTALRSFLLLETKKEMGVRQG